MRTMMQYLFQNMNFRGDAIPFKDLLRSIATEEMGHVELVANTINVLLEGHPEGANMPFMPDAPQEFSSGLDTDLRKLAQQIQV
jgi:Mn-containing catalase